jgi:hypothetical protein
MGPIVLGEVFEELGNAGDQMGWGQIQSIGLINPNCEQRSSGGIGVPEILKPGFPS